MSEARDQIRTFLLEGAQTKGVTQFTDEESLVKNGVMDSLQFFRLVAFLEDTFPIRVANEDIVQENFETIDAVDRYLARKLAENGTGGQ